MRWIAALRRRAIISLVFALFLASHLVSVRWAAIQDCDEVFNYWEPTHLLLHGHGFETWEYSPEFALRSWLYASLHALPIGLARMLPGAGALLSSKIDEFRLLRVLLAAACAGCETRLFVTIRRTMSLTTALFFLLITSTSTGMFHAAASYLPSTFAMYCTMLAFAACLNSWPGFWFASGIMWFGIGGMVGWPFAAFNIVFPMLGDLWLMKRSTSKPLAAWVLGVGRRIFKGLLRCAVPVLVQLAMDSAFYGKFAPVPLTMILYNVFGGEGRGPDIYGTEPWYFYCFNLLLNFHIWFLLALASLPLLGLALSKKTGHRYNYRTPFILLPFYTWLGLMSCQPHKEERFMYPIYPAIALNAAVSCDIILCYFERTQRRVFRFDIQPWFLYCNFICLVLVGTGLGLLRTVSLSTGYIAPLHVYEPLHHAATGVRAGDTVCLGKEWYRFPSSFFLPDGVAAKFIKSEFTGLLPGEFNRTNDGSWLGATRAIPPGMNDENHEDAWKYTDISKCHFLVDSHLPSTIPSALEPAYILDTEHWERVKCERFLDAASTPFIARMIATPDLPGIPPLARRVWGEYCLLRRKSPSQ